MATAPDSVGLHSLVPGVARRDPPRPSGVLAHWHLCSLDAPTVAVVWTWFVGRCFGVAVRGPVLGAMFLAVWIVYACDRLLDAAAAANHGAALHGLERRHWFHGVHRGRFIAVIAVAACVVCLSAIRFGLAELVLYLLLGAALSLWFGLVHSLSAERSLGLLKELAVGLFFPVAMCIPVLAGAGGGAEKLLTPMMLFGLLCTINGLFIRSWEQARAGQSPAPGWDAGSLTGKLLRLVRVLAIMCCVLPLLAAAACPHGLGFAGAAPIEVAIALSAAALLALDGAQRRVEPTELRALADLVLLTPLLLAPLLR